MLDPARIEAVQTGCCPHTAIRDDITANLDAVDTAGRAVPGAGPGDHRERRGQPDRGVQPRGLVDRQIFVVDVAGGDKVPRKGGPGVTTADLLVINKTDLAPLVGADLTVMSGDAHRVRGGLPVILQSLVDTPAAPGVASWVRAQLRRREGRRAPGGRASRGP